MAGGSRKTETHCHNGHEWKPETTYIKPSNGGKHCVLCRRAQEGIRLARPAEQQKRKQRAKNYVEKHGQEFLNRRAQAVRHGTTPEAIEAMLVEQGGCCANPGCRATKPGGRGKWPQDHDHETDRLRGLLCTCCNIALGLLHDDIDKIMGLATYLAKHKHG